jgi:hypothetical protein
MKSIKTYYQSTTTYLEITQLLEKALCLLKSSKSSLLVVKMRRKPSGLIITMLFYFI